MHQSLKFMLFVLLSYLLSCQSEQDGFLEEDPLKVKSYDMTLPHGDYLMNNSSYLNNSAGIDSIILMDGTSKSFVIGDLSEQKILKMIPYELEGANFTDAQITDLHWFNDQLFTLSRNYFTVYNADGLVKHRISLKDYEVLDPYFCASFDMIDGHHILLATTAKSAVYNGYYPAPEEDFIFAQLNWLSGDLKPLPIRSPEIALVADATRGYYNNYAYHTGIYHDSSIFYNYSFASTIYKADLNGSSQEIFEAKSKYTDQQRKPLSVNPTVMESSNYVYSEQPNFTSFMYDEVTGLYARIHGQIRGEMDEDPKNEQYLMVFDQDMQAIYETPLIFKSGTSVFTNGKVYIFTNMPDSEDAYHFTVYDFN